MTFSDYETAAMRTCPKRPSRNESLTCNALGIAGESGEFADEIKKVVFHGHGFDRDKLAKELGDVLWYVAALCNDIGISMDSVAAMNVAKLQQRYPDGFKSSDSIHRTA
jgi:NTP pyrophosphatase (non-canonical NTP hydrolase)